MFMAFALYGTYFFVVFLALNIRNSDPLEVLEVLPFFLVASRNRPNYFQIALFSKKSSVFGFLCHCHRSLHLKRLSKLKVMKVLANSEANWIFKRQCQIKFNYDKQWTKLLSNLPWPFFTTGQRFYW